VAFSVSVSRLTLALSDAVDLVGVDVVQHGKRVALLATECGRELGWGEARVRTLCLAALLHDCGVSSTHVHRQLVDTFDWEGSDEHCERGHDLLGDVELFRPLAEIVRHHHTPWPVLTASALAPDTALMSNALFLADRVDAFIHQQGESNPLSASRGVIQAMEQRAETSFAPELVAAFRAVAHRQATWFTLEPHHLERHLAGLMAPLDERPVPFEELRAIADVFSRVVDFKSPYTEEHSRGVARVARLLGSLAGLAERDCELLEVAGLLHDLGKLRVPDEVLDKGGPLTRAEGATMARHPFETYQILGRLSSIPELASWAGLHHEALDGSGYPFNLRADRLPLPARVVAVADVVQALAQDRPYRPPLTARKIVRQLRHLGRTGKLDPTLVELVVAHKEACLAAATVAA